MQQIPFSKLLRSQGVSRKARAERNRLIRKIVVFLLIITASALFCVWTRVKVVQVGYEMSGLQREAKEMLAKINNLDLELERLKSPGRLQKVAAEFLKMHPPSGKEIVFVKREK